MEKAIEKLQNELGREHNEMVPSVPILNYLISTVWENEDLAERVNLEKKTIKECFEYVLQEVKKTLSSKNGWLDDQVVYGLAEKYFMSDTIEIEKPKPKPAAPLKSVQTTNKKDVKKEEKEHQIALF